MPEKYSYFWKHVDPAFPLTYVDVGAMGGIARKWDSVRSKMRIIAFEPDDREFVKLKSDPQLTYLNVALFSQSQDLKFYVTKESGKSSVYRPNMEIVSQYPNSERFRVMQERIIPAAKVKNLDAVIQEQDISEIDFIKIDTQGSELDILSGGLSALADNFGVELEVEFLSLYEGQPLFRDVDKFMETQGFELMDLRRAYWKRKDYFSFVGKGQLIFGDALYFKRPDALKKMLAGIPKEQQCSRIYKYILICLIYRLFDYATMIARIAKEEQKISDKEFQEILSQIKKESWRGMVPNFPGRNFVHQRIVYPLVQSIRSMSYLGWADGDYGIGNAEDL
ncbi:MAG: FkbM family methyltransferase [Candidatus Omnitrophica bacterium]|nr:FkbM family methyltransferase [Candidatus Omnitrophota bacterium]